MNDCAGPDTIWPPRTTTGYVQVQVQSDKLFHITQIPVQINQTLQLVRQAQTMARSGSWLGHQLRLSSRSFELRLDGIVVGKDWKVSSKDWLR